MLPHWLLKLLKTRDFVVFVHHVCVFLVGNKADLSKTLQTQCMYAIQIRGGREECTNVLGGSICLVLFLYVGIFHF